MEHTSVVHFNWNTLIIIKNFFFYICFRLTSDYNDISDKVEQHEYRQGELQHYIHMVSCYCCHGDLGGLI